MCSSLVNICSASVFVFSPNAFEAGDVIEVVFKGVGTLHNQVVAPLIFAS